MRDRIAKPVSRDKILRREQREYFFFPVQLTTSRIGINLARVINVLPKMIHTMELLCGAVL